MGKKLYDKTIFYHQITGQSWLGGSHYFDNLTRNAAQYFPELNFVGANLYDLPAIYPQFIDRLKRKWFTFRNKRLPSDFVRQGKVNYLRSLQQGELACIYSVAVEHLRGLDEFARVFWIPDFQVHHLPQFFDQKDIAYRKKSFSEGASIADLVVLSSESAREDLKRFYPEYLAKSRVLNFVVDVDPNVFKVDSSYLLTKYNLQDKFFYVPNQFWRHKNHLLIIDAMRHAITSEPDIHIVFSGSSEDQRNPDYYPALLNTIRNYGLEHNITILGIIPKDDVLQLVRQSCCLINASRFEGWSTTVEEVKSIGKRILLSDINVHREQNPPKAEYFGCDDIFTLSSLMIRTWQVSDPGPDRQMEETARSVNEERKVKFATQFKEIIDEAIKVRNSK